MTEYDKKVERLHQILAEMTKQNIAVAFSGGVDSSLLLKIACMHSTRQHTQVYAYTAATILHQTVDLDMAQRVAGEIGAKHMVLEMDELTAAGIEENPPNRCYLCKRYLFQRMLQHAKAQGISYMIEGSNLDDTKGYRPGIKAVAELGIRSPLMEAEFTKADVRRLASELQISTANRPSTPCMATRFPYGVRLTRQGLEQVEKAESFLRTFPFENIRVRVHGDVARIEIDAIYFSQLLEHRESIVERLRQLGYVYVTLDLRGFQSGSMDEKMMHNVGDIPITLQDTVEEKNG